MKKSSFKEKLQYRFDNLMSKGSVVLVGILFLATALVAIIVGLILLIVDNGNSLGANIWTSVMHIIDAGTITGAETTNIAYIVLLSIATICGLFVTSILIGIITTGFEEKLNSLKKGNSKVIEKDHTVILGFNANTYTLISELITANENKKRGCIVILTEQDKETVESLIAENIEDFKTTKIICRTGNITDISSLKNCSLENCSSIIINTVEDFLTVKVILAVNNFLKNSCADGNMPHIVTTINYKENYEAAKIISEGNLEMILVENSISRIIAQTCRQPGLSNVLIELFDYDGDELYFENFPEFEGENFGNILNKFEKAIVFGFERNGEIHLNPDMSTVIQANDNIIMLVEDDGMAKISNVKSQNYSDFKTTNTITTNKPENVLIIGSGHLLSKIVSVLDTFYIKGSEVYIANDDENFDAEKLSSTLENITLKTYLCDTSKRDVLEMLLENNTDNILLLSDENTDEETSDALTLLKLIHLRDIAQKHHKNFSITSELKRVENQKLAQITKANDLVVGSNIINLILTQISENRQLSNVFQELLQSDGSEMYIKKASNYLKLNTEMDFYAVTDILKDLGEIAIGYKKQTGNTFEIITNPLKSDLIIFTEEDYIITLADN